MIKLKPSVLRTTTADPEVKKSLQKNPVYIVLDNVMDTYNVGAIFRLADAVAAEKVYLCGATETPPNSRIKKASINTTEWVTWEYAETAVDAIKKVRNEFSTSFTLNKVHVLEQSFDKAQHRYSSSEAKRNREVQVIAVEQSSKSVPYDTVDYSFPIALVVGHESNGVSKEVLDICDTIVELPMWGVNVSLNVMVSLGIVLYKVMESIKK